MSDEDAHWRLGLARVRAQQILRLLELCSRGEIAVSATLKAIHSEAQAILDQPTTEDEPT